MRRLALAACCAALAAAGACGTQLKIERRAFRCGADAGVPLRADVLRDAGPDAAVDAGDPQCPGGWSCNPTWGRCFDPDAGTPTPCSRDGECGGGWRCSTDGVCVDPSEEGTPTVLGPVPPPVLLHPLLRPSGELRAADLVARAGQQSASSVAWRAGGGVTWLLFQDDASGDVVRTTVRVLQAAALTTQDFTPTARPTPTGFEHTLWSIGPAQQLRALTSDVIGPVNQVASAGSLSPVTRLSSFKVAGELPRGASGFVAAWSGTDQLEVRTTAGGAVSGFRYSLGVPPGSVEHVAAFTLAPGLCRGPGADAGQFLTAAVFSGDGGVRVIPLGDAGLVDAPPGGVWTDASTAGATAGAVRFVELDKLYAVWAERGASGERLVWLPAGQLCSPAPALSAIEACPRPGLRLVDFTLQRLGEQVVPVRECASADGTAHFVFTGTSLRPLPARRGIVAKTSESYSFYDFGLVTWGEPARVEQVPLMLPAPPESVFRAASGQLVFWGKAAGFAAGDAGIFLGVRSSRPEFVVAAALPAPGRHLLAMRDGTLGYEVENDAGRVDLDVVAYPVEAWKDPDVPVLGQALSLSDGGTVVAVTHDATLDVAELSSTRAELVPRLRPSPGFPITSLALRASDAGVATGYAIAGVDLFAIEALSTRRWESTRVPLAGALPVHVFFDGERPRAVTDDGRLVGLSTRVPLSPPTDAPVVAATSACRVPFALTADGLYALAAVDGGVGWTSLALKEEGADGGKRDFSTARLYSLGKEVVVVSREGFTWRLEACP